MKKVSPLRIVHVIADPGPGGAPRHLAHLVRGLAAADTTLHQSLVCPAGWLANELGTTIETTSFQAGNALHPGRQRELREILTTYLRETNDEQLIFHFQGFRAGLMGRLVLRQIRGYERARVVYTEHTWTQDLQLYGHWTSPLRQLSQLVLMRLLDRVTHRTIAVSHAVEKFLLAKKITTPEKLAVIYNGVPALELSSRNQELRRGERGYRIGSVGSLTPQKDFLTLIDALPLVLQNIPDVQCEIIGAGPEEKRLTQRIHQLKLDRQVRLLGESTDTAPYIQEWDLFVSTSTSESFGLAIAEAMALGKAVIATQVGGVPEVIGDTGILVPPKDPHALAKVIIDLLPKEKLRRELGQRGHERVIKEFNVERMVNETLAVYRRLASGQ